MLDERGENVNDDTPVEFTVVALGTANPVASKTSHGQASSTITPLSASSAGVTVVVTSGDASASIRVDCALPGVAIISSSGHSYPTLIKTASAHRFTTGQSVRISGHSVAALNGDWTITAIDATTFSVPFDSSGPGGFGGTATAN